MAFGYRVTIQTRYTQIQPRFHKIIVDQELWREDFARAICTLEWVKKKFFEWGQRETPVKIYAKSRLILSSSRLSIKVLRQKLKCQWHLLSDEWRASWKSKRERSSTSASLPLVTSHTERFLAIKIPTFSHCIHWVISSDAAQIVGARTLYADDGTCRWNLQNAADERLRCSVTRLTTLRYLST